jgi:phosphate:Na+ symporter
MANIIIYLLSILGALGVFLFGMKLMSEALQKMAGFRMRAILAAITSNKMKSVMSGLVITAMIQSSSATSVMIVGFVNAGLLSLTESVGMIMGANIGTTLKAWLFVAIGVNIKVSQFALPLVALFFPLLFAKKNILKYCGEFVMGFAIIFFGLDLLYGVLPDLTSNVTITQFLSRINDLGAVSVVLFVLVGAALAAIFQSSSTALVFTLSFSAIGIIDFRLAAAMVIGENIGTTITANLAAIVADENAKKAARTHFLFNLIGALWVLSVFPIFLKGVDGFVYSIFHKSAYNDPGMIPWALATIHTSFNLINTLLLVWFIPMLIKVAGLLVKRVPSKDNIFRLPFLSKTIFSTSEISILQARKEIVQYSKRVKAMFKLVKSMFNEMNEESFNNAFNQVSSYETVCDQIELELSSYLTKVGQGELSAQSNERLKVMLKITSNLESVADNCYNIAKTLKKKRQARIWFTQDIRNNINEMLELINEAIEVMHENLNTEFSLVTADKAEACEEKIDQLRNNLKEDYSSNTDKGYRYEAGVIYNDIYTRCERMGDHVYSITRTIVQSNRELR